MEASGRHLADSELMKLDVPGSFQKVEVGQADWQREASGAGAAGVDIEDAIVHLRFRFVGVAADDDAKAGGGGVEVKFVEIVEDVD